MLRKAHGIFPDRYLDYQRVKITTERAVVLAQNIVDARLALTRLRQTHPQPRLTIPLADQKLVDQVTEMQTLSDEVAVVKKKVQAVKEQAKSRALEVEKLRMERAEAEKAVKMSQVEEDDSRLVPLYDWSVSFRNQWHRKSRFLTSISSGTPHHLPCTNLSTTFRNHSQPPRTNCI